MISPNGAASPQSLALLNSPTNFQIPRGHLRVWMPFAGNFIFDSTPNIFYNGSSSATAFAGLEIPDDATMAQVIYANGSTAGSVTLKNAAIWGSSQWAAAGYTGKTPGITPYDSGGNALTYMTLLSFGNNGVDTAPNEGYQTSVPANATNATTNATTSTASTVLNFASVTCPPTGSTIAIITDGTATNNPALYANTTVLSCVANTSVTMSATPRVTIQSGVTVYFMPPGITIPAATSAVLPNLAFSDWAPLTTYPRIDGPIMSGMTILNNGTPISGTISSTTATAAIMSINLASDIPPGTALQACQTAVISGAYAPANQIQFANSVTNLGAGMYAWTGSTGPATTTYRSNTVASVATATNTVVTMTKPIDPNGASTSIGSATTWYFGQYATVSSVSGSTITLASVTNISSGMSIYQNVGGIGVNGATYAATISGIAGNVVTMSSAVPAGIVAGMQLLFVTSAASNAATALSITPTYSAQPPNVYQGMQVVGSGIDPATYVWYYGATIAYAHPPNTTLSNGQTIYFCNNVTTSVDSPAGQANINFSQTNYPNRLVLVRNNFGSANTNFWAAATNTLSAWTSVSGNNPNIIGGQCTFGTDGVLTLSNIGNSSGGCSAYTTYIPIYAIKFYSPRRGITIAVVGDSHVEGDTTIGNNMNFAARAAALLNNPNTLPVSAMNLAWGGQPSMIYGPKAMQMLKSVQPEVVFIQYTTPNDTSSAAGVANMTATALSIASYVRSYGGLPIVVPDYQRQKYGCDTVNSATDAYRLTGETLLNSAALAGLPTLDLPSLILDQTNGATYFAANNTNDCVHANDNGHAIMGAAAATLVGRYLRLNP